MLRGTKSIFHTHRNVAITQICLSPCSSLPSSTPVLAHWLTEHWHTGIEWVRLLFAVATPATVWLHAKNFIILVLFLWSLSFLPVSACLHQFHRFFFSPLLIFHSLFTAFYESFMCNYNVSNIIINIYEKHWLSEINLSQKIYSRSLNHWFLFRFSQHLHSFEPHKLNFMAVAFFLIIFLKSEI